MWINIQISEAAMMELYLRQEAETKEMLYWALV